MVLFTIFSIKYDAISLLLPPKMEYWSYPHSVTSKTLDNIYETIYDIGRQPTKNSDPERPKKKKKGDSPMSSFPVFKEFSCCGTSKGYLDVLSKLRKQSLGSKKILSK